MFIVTSNIGLVDTWPQTEGSETVIIKVIIATILLQQQKANKSSRQTQIVRNLLDCSSIVFKHV